MFKSILIFIIFISTIEKSRAVWQSTTIHRIIKPNKFYSHSITFEGITKFKGVLKCTMKCNAFLLTENEFKKYKNGQSFKQLQGMRGQKEIKWKLINQTEIFEQEPIIVVENVYSKENLTSILVIETNPNVSIDLLFELIFILVIGVCVFPTVFLCCCCYVLFTCGCFISIFSSVSNFISPNEENYYYNI
eukprot:gene6919-11082_t